MKTRFPGGRKNPPIVEQFDAERAKPSLLHGQIAVILRKMAGTGLSGNQAGFTVIQELLKAGDNRAGPRPTQKHDFTITPNLRKP